MIALVGFSFSPYAHPSVCAVSFRGIDFACPYSRVVVKGLHIIRDKPLFDDMDEQERETGDASDIAMEDAALGLAAGAVGPGAAQTRRHQDQRQASARRLRDRHRQ